MKHVDEREFLNEYANNMMLIDKELRFLWRAVVAFGVVFALYVIL